MTRIEDKTGNGDRCRQCGATDPAEGFTTTVVTHRKSCLGFGFSDEEIHRGDHQYVGRTRFTVCKGTPCGAHLQMAHEG